ncbi:MAG: wax ester/triacylglycerol synthase domain-containing protein, partial [Actinomycetota bacterium]
KVWPRSARLPKFSLGRPEVSATVGRPFHVQGDDPDADTDAIMEAIVAPAPTRSPSFRPSNRPPRTRGPDTMAERRPRDVDVSTRMTDHEALMWNVEKDPWLNPNGASLTLLDQPVDMARFRAGIAYGVTRMPRLYQRVVPELGRLAPPTWAPDPEFDFDYHVREVRVAQPGTMRQLLDLAAQLYQEPLDRTRPLWRFVAISGLEGGKGAVYALTHHVIADGIGQLRMAELYQQIDRDQLPPEQVDLDAFLADVLAREGVGTSDGDPTADALGELVDTTRSTASHILRRQAGMARRMIGEVAMWGADTSRVTDTISEVVDTVKTTAGLVAGGGLTGGDGGDSPDGGERPRSGSPLWRNRSRHRHLEHVQIPLDGLKAASKALGGSINDGFMVGLTEGAVRYHEARGTAVDSFNTSFVISTRTDAKMGGNSFTPVPVRVSGAVADFPTRMRELHQITDSARDEVGRSGGLSALSGIINLLPTSLVTQTARRQAASMDFATSNLRGAPFRLYCAGAEVEGTVCMGPLAGTAVNATALSYDGQFDVGLFIDPVAVEDPADYKRCIEEAFADLLTLAEPVPESNGTSSEKTSDGDKASAGKASAAKTSAASKGSGSKKSATKKSGSKKPAAKAGTATASASTNGAHST